jgi:pyruvate dehydrogenase E1 component alpha subunit
MKKDPIKRFEAFLIKNGVFKKENLINIRREVKTEVEEAHHFAKASLNSNPKEIVKYVFKE